MRPLEGGLLIAAFSIITRAREQAFAFYSRKLPKFKIPIVTGRTLKKSFSSNFTELRIFFKLGLNDENLRNSDQR